MFSKKAKKKREKPQQPRLKIKSRTSQHWTYRMNVLSKFNAKKFKRTVSALYVLLRQLL